MQGNIEQLGQPGSWSWETTVKDHCLGCNQHEGFVNRPKE